MNHGSVGRSCYKTLTKEPEDSGVCKPHTYIASHADVLSGCGARTHDEPLLAVLFAECAYDMSGETAGGFFSPLFFSPLVCARFYTCFCSFAARSSALSTNKPSATHCCVGVVVVGKRPKYLVAHPKKTLCMLVYFARRLAF